ncbi:hypothetical protein [Streptomyces marispadix]|uniref:Integral membrane protein n=1 Tax=Streptomyces marispadix TaxID=2922868 RepID=A0ABS9T5J7_9ACTN|nr:hypothetical protein [Streptomyces marispadix]MCH6163797.1 hypothetical protein [Streptomyces marispadix]
MTDDHAERTHEQRDEQPDGQSVEKSDGQGCQHEPWWAGLGTRGAVGLVVLGGIAAAWTFLAPAAGLGWLPFTPEEAATGYYQAAKVAAIGLVILGSALLGRRSRGAGAEEAKRPERD